MFDASNHVLGPYLYCCWSLVLAFWWQFLSWRHRLQYIVMVWSFPRLLKLHKLAVRKFDLSRGGLTRCHGVLNHRLNLRHNVTLNKAVWADGIEKMRTHSSCRDTTWALSRSHDCEKRLAYQNALINWHCKAILCIPQSTNICWMALQRSQREGDDRWKMLRQAMKVMKWEGTVSFRQTQSRARSHCMCTEGWTIQGAPHRFCWWSLQSGPLCLDFVLLLLGESWWTEAWLSATHFFSVLSAEWLTMGL